MFRKAEGKYRVNKKVYQLKKMIFLFCRYDMQQVWSPLKKIHGVFTGLTFPEARLLK